MSKDYPRKGEEWIPIYIPGNLPLLDWVSSSDHPSYYRCRWRYKTDEKGKILPMQLIIKRVDQTDTYPHLTIEFNTDNGDVVEFHHSKYDKDRKKISVGSQDLKLFITLVIYNFTTDDILSLLSNN